MIEAVIVGGALAAALVLVPLALPELGERRDARRAARTPDPVVPAVVTTPVNPPVDRLRLAGRVDFAAMNRQMRQAGLGSERSGLWSA